MAFDFPDSPAINDEYVSGGATYIYTAQGVWDLGSSAVITDYVLKAGDTMTGALRITDAAAAPLSLGGLNKRIIQFDNCWIAQRNGAHGQEGMLQIWTNNGGYSDALCLETTIQSGAAGIRTPGRSFFGGVTVSGANVSMGEGAGIHWGNTSAVTSHTDLTEGICLYGWGTTSKFGFNITSGTLGYCVENVGNRHCFTVGGVERFIINKDGAFNTSGHFRTAEVDGMGIRLYGNAYIYKKIGTGMVLRRSSNDVQWQTEMNDGSGTAPVATSSLTTFKDMGLALPDLKDDPELQPFARKDEGIEGFDVAKVLTLMLAKIKLLETEIATLKGAR